MTNRFQNRPLSYSQLSCWEYSKEEWMNRYILGIRSPMNATMEAGTRIGDAIGTDNCPLKTAQSKPHYVQPSGVKEFKLSAKLGDIHLIGYADHFDPVARVLHENKTSTNKSRWSQPKANAHGQLTMYALILFLTHNITPEDVQMYLNFIPTQRRLVPKPEYSDVPDWALDEHICDEVVELPDPVVWKQYPTTRTAGDITAYVDYIHETVKAMQEYVDNRVETTG